MTKYTFLLPAYKEAFLEEALNSIRSQTYTDFKCIVSDDHSPEELKTVYDRVVGDDPRFTYRRNEENIGGNNLVSHWNLLVNLCETEYFMMAGDDDLYAPNFLVEVDKLFVKYPKIGAVRARTQNINSEGTITSQDDCFPEIEEATSYLYSKYTCKHLGGVLNFAYNKEILLQEGGFPEMPIAWFSDIMSGLICSKYGICNTSQVLCSMRVSGINLSCQLTRPIAEKKLQAAYIFYDWITNFIQENYDFSSLLNKNNYLRIEAGVKEIMNVHFRDCFRVVSKKQRFGIFKFMKHNHLFLSRQDGFSILLSSLL